MLPKTKLGAIALALCSVVAHAETFVIKTIRVEGLRKISLGTVRSYLPIKEGDQLDTEQTGEIVRSLYQTRFFSDVVLKRSNDDLIIQVVERATIGQLKVSGNKKITQKQLRDALKNVGVVEGQELDPATLHAIQQAIIQQYYSLGLYDPKVAVDVRNEDRNRAVVAIKIDEGPVSKIHSIKIVGNHVFKERALLKELSLSKSKLWSFFTGSDQYSKEKLDADLEKLRSYYMDRGYLNVKIEDAKVSITPDKKSIYIVINVTEGPLYRFGGIELGGDLIGKNQEIAQLLTVKPGAVFSRKMVLDNQSKIAMFLGDCGYGMADVRHLYRVDDNQQRVWIKFVVAPGHRVYVRHIDFVGNRKTRDGVLRQEMRLQEGGLFSLAKINESARRLANLGYLQDVDHKATPVAGVNNQVDLEYSFKETSAISLNFQAGLSDRDGFIYGASVTDQNVFGTGREVSLQFNNSRSVQSYGLSYYNPYFTQDKIGFSLSGYIHKSDPNRVSAELSSYRSSTYGLLASFDAPLSDYSQVSMGLGFEYIDFTRAFNPNSRIDAFIEKYGKRFSQVKLVTSLGYNRLDRAIFPTQGFAHSVSGEIYGPVSSKSLEFYKVNYMATYYQPLVKDFVMRMRGEVGYGGGIGRTKELPPFKNFFAGGIGSVRGFEADTISGEQDKGRVVGGNLLTMASASIIIPNPMQGTIRPSIFVDVGSVYNDSFRFKDLRSSYGIQLEWRTPLAPLVFSLARPLHKHAWDEVTLFQFSISTSV